ncbi:hypothetical protein [Nocardia wallacei]|uniref:hypothetical protein n=1 Tax=Nocardia wallacei TaxID=480035 RepID=UPI001656BF5F|nr:hypothetical protein [Nocardia wallacei]
MQAAGLGFAQVARLAGVDHVTVGRVARDPQARVTAEVEAAILAVKVPERAADVTPENALVPIHGAQRRVQALIASGYPRAHLARLLGMRSNSGAMEALIGKNYRGGQAGKSVLAARDRQVKELFDRLQFLPGPSERARAKGRRSGWALPFEWDEAALDDPRGKPVRARWTSRSTTDERRDQVAELTERGLSAQEIAERLGTTDRTVQRDRAYTRSDPKQPVAQQFSQIEAMGAVAVQARRDIAARREAAPVRPSRRERTR